MCRYCFLLFRYIPSNNPLSLTLPSPSLSPALSFLPTRDKSAPCCDSIVRLFHINLTAGINQCDSSSVIPKEIPRYIRVEGPFDPRKTHRVSLMASCLILCVCVCAVCACSSPSKTLAMRHRAFPRVLQETLRVQSSEVKGHLLYNVITIFLHLNCALMWDILANLKFMPRFTDIQNYKKYLGKIQNYIETQSVFS